jgi:hypothetical protein
LWLAVAAALVALAAVVHLRWRADENRKGTLTLDCPDDAFAVEIRTARPPTIGEVISGSDVGPQWSTCGRPSPEERSRRCVWFQEVERSAVEIKLPPGRYLLGAHRKSPCGHYGGDRYQTFDVEEGGRVAITIPH